VERTSDDTLDRISHGPEAKGGVEAQPSRRKQHPGEEVGLVAKEVDTSGRFCCRVYINLLIITYL
jgi:hypothetical protein